MRNLKVEPVQLSIGFLGGFFWRAIASTVEQHWLPYRLCFDCADLEFNVENIRYWLLVCRLHSVQLRDVGVAIAVRFGSICNICYSFIHCFRQGALTRQYKSVWIVHWHSMTSVWVEIGTVFCAEIFNY